MQLFHRRRRSAQPRMLNLLPHGLGDPAPSQPLRVALEVLTFAAFFGVLVILYVVISSPPAP